jgi:hypothetical protein
MHSMMPITHPEYHIQKIFIFEQCHIVLRAIATVAPFSPDCGAPLPALSLEIFLEL